MALSNPPKLTMFANPLRPRKNVEHRPASCRETVANPSLELSFKERMEDVNDNIGPADTEVELSETESDTIDTPISHVESQYKATSRRQRQKSSRHQHIQVLVSLIHHRVLNRDWDRALRAFSMLIRCKNVEIRLCYEIGLEILDHTSPDRSLEFLKRLIIAFPPAKSKPARNALPRAETFVRLMAQRRLKYGQFKEAVEELEEYLLVPPFNQDMELWDDLYLACDSLEKQSDDDEATREVWRARKERASVRLEALKGSSAADTQKQNMTTKLEVSYHAIPQSMEETR